MGSKGSLSSESSIGSKGSIGSNGSICSEYSMGSIGTMGSIVTIRSVRGRAGCSEHLCSSVPLPIGLGVSSGGPPAGEEARPPRTRAGEEEPGAGNSGWEPFFCVGSVPPRCGGVGEKVDDCGCGSRSILAGVFELLEGLAELLRNAKR